MSKHNRRMKVKKLCVCRHVEVMIGGTFLQCPKAQMPPLIQVWNRQQTSWLITLALTLITMAEILSSLQQRRASCQEEAQMASGKNNQGNCESPGDELEYFCGEEEKKLPRMRSARLIVPGELFPITS